MRKVLVLGAFGYSNNQLDGQTIKTRNVYNLLAERYEGKVEKVDTQDLRTKPWLLFSLQYQLMTCKTLILLPCLNNLSYIFPVVYFLSKVYRYEIISICIGGWQVEYFQGNERFKAHPKQLKYSKRIKAFLPEMAKVDQDLKNLLDFKNTEVFPNFRRFALKDISEEKRDELRLVFMARINKTKGYRTIFKVIDSLQKTSSKVSMTFYGQVAEEDRNDFEGQIEKYKGVVSYKGALKPEVIQQTLSQYDVMLLLTQYYTEGFPGSILDAYIAGIPVIVTEWKHSHEFVDEGNTGFIVPFGECVDEVVDRINKLFLDKQLLVQMKKKAQKESINYSEDKAWEVLQKYL
jgi:glycosyltransferase involved in cell wall biosynthesis